MFLGRVKQWYCRSDGQQCQPHFFGKCWFTKKGTPLLAVCKLIWTYMKYHLFGGLSLYSIQINSMALNQLIRLWCTGRSFRGCLQKWWGLITWDHMGLTSKPAQQVRGEHDYELQICRSWMAICVTMQGGHPSMHAFGWYKTHMDDLSSNILRNWVTQRTWLGTKTNIRTLYE